MVATRPRDQRSWIRTQERDTKLARQGAQQLSRGVQRKVGQAVEDIEERRKLRPTAPVEIEAETTLYFDTTNRKKARLIVEFPDVMYSTNRIPIIVERYELWGYNSTLSPLGDMDPAYPGLMYPGLTYPGATVSTVTDDDPPEEWRLLETSQESSFRSEGYIPNDFWTFRVRAFARGSSNAGNWSQEFTVQMLKDVTPPAQPTAPTVVFDRGIAEVTWDGQAVTGTMPANFSYAILAGGPASSPTTEIHRWGRGGGFTQIAGIPYMQTWHFRVQAVDEAGNRSPWSESATGFPTPLVDKDIILSTLDAARTHLININAGVSILPNTVIAEHMVATESLTAKFAQFLYIKSDKIDVNSLAADNIFTGLLDAKIVRSDMFVGKVFTGGRFYGTLFETDVEENKGMKWGNLSLRAYSPGGVETFKVDNTTGNVTMRAGTLTGMRFQTTELTNRGIKLDASGLRSWTDTGIPTFVMDAVTGNVEFTGSVKTSVEGENIIIAKNAYANKPGIILDTGKVGGFEPTLWAAGIGSSEEGVYRLGTAVLMGRETTQNSSGRSELVLNEGGDFSLEQAWGLLNNGIGIRKIGEYLQLKGRHSELTSGMLSWRFGGEGGLLVAGASADYNFALTPPRVGRHDYMVTVYCPETAGSNVGISAHVSGTSDTLTRVTLRNNGTGPASSFSVRMLGLWR